MEQRHGCFVANDVEVRGSTFGFPAAGHNKKGKSAEGWVLAAGDRGESPIGISYTAALDICVQDTGNIGGAGGPTAYFWRLCVRDGL